ncbi:MAG: ABC transporter ATP-binding protein [Chloroflexota bacterium]
MIAVGQPREPVIRVRGLRKAYGAHEAVRGIDLDVRPGEVVALLGPNGAGKTTTLEILEGYRDRTAGEVLVLGGDPGRRDPAIVARIGICLQASGIERYLTVTEVLDLYAGYYPRPRPTSELLALVGLTGQAGTRVRRLSGGQRRRLDLALALVGGPELLFLDEPTTGFDPEARRQAWELVRGLVGAGRTVLLSTHFMDEARALADRVVVVVGGLVVAEGTPDQVIGERAAGSVVRFRLGGGVGPGTRVADLPAGIADAARTTADGAIEIATREPTGLLHALTGWAIDAGAQLDELSVMRPSLEDAYLALVAEHASQGEGLGQAAGASMPGEGPDASRPRPEGGAGA